MVFEILCERNSEELTGHVSSLASNKSEKTRKNRNVTVVVFVNFYYLFIYLVIYLFIYLFTLRSPLTIPILIIFINTENFNFETAVFAEIAQESDSFILVNSFITEPFSLTLASFTVTSESCVASTTIRAASIVAFCIYVTHGRRSATLVNVWKPKKQQQNFDSFFSLLLWICFTTLSDWFNKTCTIFSTNEKPRGDDTCNRFDFWLAYAVVYICGDALFFLIRTSKFSAEAEPKLNVLIFLAIWAWDKSISVNHSSEWKKEQIGQVLPIS